MSSDGETKLSSTIHLNHPTTNLALNRRNLQKLSEPEKETLLELRKLHFETAQFEIELHRSIFAIEEGTDSEYHKIYEKRKQVLQKFRNPKENEKDENEKEKETVSPFVFGPLRNFWLKVLKTANIEINPDEDEKILQHLIDVRSKMFVNPRVKMVIEFEFEENEYFKNTLLTKTYYIKCDADPKDAIIYDGIEITSMEGCKINWLIERGCGCGEGAELTTDVNRVPSFFEYFNDHSESENLNRALLSEEIAFGFFLREKVIPKAVYFFTGEIRAEKDENSEENENEYQDYDHNAEAEDEAEEDDDDDDEDDEDEDEDRDIAEAEGDIDVDDGDETGDDETYETCSDPPEDEVEQDEEKEMVKVRRNANKDKEEYVKEDKKLDIFEFKELTEFEEDLLELLEEPEYVDALTDDAFCLTAKNEKFEKFENENKGLENKKNLLAEQKCLTNLSDIEVSVKKDDNLKIIETVEDLAKHVLVSENIYVDDNKSFLRVSNENTRKLTITEEMSRIASRAILEEQAKTEYKKD